MEPELGFVSIVVVTWNSAPYLRRCLEGIRDQTHQQVELIAIDNASSDNSVALVEAAGARVIRNDENRGFSAAVNQALTIARGEFVQLVNPDCFLEPSYIATLVAALREAGEACGGATGKLIKAVGWDIEPTRAIDSVGMRMTRSGRHLDRTDALAQREEVFGLSGAAPLYRTSFLRDLSMDGEVLDEDFFAYREDADLAWRGRLFGWTFLCEPAAIGYHVRRVTPEVRRRLPSDVNMHSVKNRFLLRLKNEGLYLALRNAPFELTRDLIVLAASLTIERTSLPAFAWLWRNRARVLAKRRAVQQRRKVSDRELARWWR
ncbi:MAG TPA: glycosyltransferase family 2 protein [Thermoanaerobaculia bacterium]